MLTSTGTPIELLFTCVPPLNGSHTVFHPIMPQQSKPSATLSVIAGESFATLTESIAADGTCCGSHRRCSPALHPHACAPQVNALALAADHVPMVTRLTNSAVAQTQSQDALMV